MKKKSNSSLLDSIAEIDIIYKRKTNIKISERPCINSTKDAYKIFRRCWNKDKIELLEEFKILLLNKGNRVLQLFHAFDGGITGTVADIRLILGVALKVAACSIVIAHNHPSGEVQPSRLDIELTEKLRKACSYHDLKLFDHIILTRNGYFSFSDADML